MAEIIKLSWDPGSTAGEINSLLETLGQAYNIAPNKADSLMVDFVSGGPAGKVTVTRKGLQATVTYDLPHLAARGIGTLLAGLAEEGKGCVETTPFDRYGIMLDCSRFAVMTVETVKEWMRQLALMGYNVVMLYTEETYELPGEPYFGYQRGRYSAEELKEIDAYGAKLNIEVVGCIQTLGHLEHIMKWPAYSKVKDTGTVMLVDEDATYELIDKMLAQYSACCRSRRIHIGMDETLDLGRGIFLNRHGYERPFDLFNRHLKRVVELCKKYDLKPMIWSDMYFAMGNTEQDHYALDTVIPEEVREAIPAQADFVHWDYYHDDEKFYSAWIDKHRELGKEPIVASGVWTWLRLWYDHQITTDHALPCIKACRDKGVKELLFTMWGDNGGYCEFNSALAGLAMCAEHAYAGESCDEDKLAKRFAAICNADYQTVIGASDVNHLRLAIDEKILSWQFGSIDALLWDDPIRTTAWKEVRKVQPDFWASLTATTDALVEKLSAGEGVTSPIDMDHAYRHARLFQKRYALNLALAEACQAQDKEAIKACRDEIPDVIQAVEDVNVSMRRQWLRNNKPQGLYIEQQRFGGMKERYRELERQLGEYLDGKKEALDEFMEGL